ncbi:MAG: hypothetical protein CL739_04830 [Chloroflexi bacterium]|nr:hypothetical protein [Chloroflexota bacterium]|tara:strand:+ start:1796 stop:2230 length:435 start_codon:yes stop_codon:yes gene_type:complete
MKTLSKTNSDTLAVIADLIIPREGTLPSPTDINIVEHIDDSISRTPRLIRLFVEGLKDIEGKDFLILKEKEQIDFLEKYESSHNLFFNELIRHTYNGYYTNPMVIKAIGMTGLPPQPTGYDLEQGENFKLLEKVRDRGQIWRNP